MRIQDVRRGDMASVVAFYEANRPILGIEWSMLLRLSCDTERFIALSSTWDVAEPSDEPVPTIQRRDQP